MALLFHDEELTELMEDFYVLTGIRTALYDENCNLLISYPNGKETFCSCMRKNIEFEKKCLESDRNSFKQCMSTKKLCIYKCHAGLTEAAVPIIENDRVIGYMMFGQVTGNSNKKEIQLRLETLCREYCAPLSIYEKINKIKYRSDRQIRAAAKILDSLTEYIRLKGMVQLSKKRLIKPIEDFIDAHISEPISVERLCREFSVSRTKLYKIMGEYQAGGIASFIHRRRLEKSKLLIKNTDMSVSEIADAVGFADYNYFLRCFKREYGVSTKKYLKSVKGIDESMDI